MRAPTPIDFTISDPWYHPSANGEDSTRLDLVMIEVASNLAQQAIK
jgi:cobyrinic acid a,c-diamide synthase